MGQKSLLAVVLLAGLAASTATAQKISVGVLGGAPFSDVVSATTANNVSSVATSNNFIVGPAIQLTLPLNLRVEVDALYRPYSFQLVTPFTTTRVDANQWQFPILGQYRFKAPFLDPFVEGGFQYDHLANVSAAAKSVSSGLGQLIQQSHPGFVVGGGADLKIPFFRFSAEIRYVRQGSADFRTISNQDQVEFLVGIHF